MDPLLRRVFTQKRGDSLTAPAAGPYDSAHGMRCDSELVAAFAEGRLKPAERIHLEGHLAQCATCRRMATAMSLEQPEALPGIKQATSGAWWARWRWNWAVPVLATALIVGSVVFYQRDQILRRSAERQAAQQQKAVAEQQTAAQRQEKPAEPDLHPGTKAPAVESPAPIQHATTQLRRSNAPTIGTPGTVATPSARNTAELPPSAVTEPEFDRARVEPAVKQRASSAPAAASSGIAATAAAPLAVTQPSNALKRRDAAGESAAAPQQRAMAAEEDARAKKTLPQQVAPAAAAADASGFAKDKVEALQDKRDAPPPMATPAAPAPPRSESGPPQRQLQAARKAEPQSTSQSAPGAAGAVTGRIAGQAPGGLAVGQTGGVIGGAPGAASGARALSPLPGGIPLRASTQYEGRTWAVSDGGRIFRSVDAGRTWVAIPSPTTEDLAGIRWDAPTASLMVKDKQGREYRVNP